MTFSSRSIPEPGTLESLQDLGVSHVTLITFGYQPNIEATSIRFDPERRWYTESDSGISEIAAAARRLNIGTILKPHIWLGGHRTTGQRRDRIGFDTEAEWAAWESSYLEFILHYANLAQRIEAEVFVIGTELATAARKRPQFWRSAIEQIRQVYGGKLTYAANWYAEYEDIEFWSALDYVGVQAYFPLSDSEGPPLQSLLRGWQPHAAALASVSRKARRPVFFTEIGYRSVSDAARQPWRWVSREEVGIEKPDLELQANLYRAFFAEVWRQPWFAGASVWRWHTASESSGPVRALDFTPQGKPSLSVIRNGYLEQGEPSVADQPPAVASPPDGN